MRLLIIILTISAFSAGYIASELVVTAQVGYDRQFEVVEVEVTAYSPSKAQTSGNPFEMASTLIAIPNDLWELKYIAVSRDLRADYNIKWGDKIFVEFEVQDLMGETANGERIEKTVDIFMHSQQIALNFGRQFDRTIIIERR